MRRTLSGQHKRRPPWGFLLGAGITYGALQLIDPYPTLSAMARQAFAPPNRTMDAIYSGIENARRNPSRLTPDRPAYFIP